MSQKPGTTYTCFIEDLADGITSTIQGNTLVIEGMEYQFAPTETPGIFIVEFNNRSVPVQIRADGVMKVDVMGLGTGMQLRVFRPNHAMAAKQILKAGPSARSFKVTAPMPGLLRDVRIQNGLHVRKGDTLFILEAMKMENAIKAPITGSVTGVNGIVNSSIEKGLVLCVIEEGAG